MRPEGRNAFDGARDARAVEGRGGALSSRARLDGARAGSHHRSRARAEPVPALSSQRDVAVPPWIAAALFAQGDPEGPDELASRAAGLDDVVDIATLGGDVRVREPPRVLAHQPTSSGRRVSRRLQFAMEHDVD